MEQARKNYSYLIPRLAGYADPTITKYRIMEWIHLDIDNPGHPKPVLQYARDHTYKMDEVCVVQHRDKVIEQEFYELTVLKNMVKYQNVALYEVMLFRDVSRTSVLRDGEYVRSDKLEFANFAMLGSDGYHPMYTIVKTFIACAMCKLMDVDVVCCVNTVDFAIPLVVAAWLNGIKTVSFYGGPGRQVHNNIATLMRESRTLRALIQSRNGLNGTTETILSLYTNMASGIAAMEFKDAIEELNVETAQALLDSGRLDPSWDDNWLLEYAVEDGSALFVDLLLQDDRVTLKNNNLLWRAIDDRNQDVARTLIASSKIDTSHPWLMQAAYHREQYDVFQVLHEHVIECLWQVEEVHLMSCNTPIGVFVTRAIASSSSDRCVYPPTASLWTLPSLSYSSTISSHSSSIAS